MLPVCGELFVTVFVCGPFRFLSLGATPTKTHASSQDYKWRNHGHPANPAFAGDKGDIHPANPVFAGDKGHIPPGGIWHFRGLACVLKESSRL